MKNPRRFRLRNRAIVEEVVTSITQRHNGFLSSYKIIELGDSENHSYGDVVYLMFARHRMPTGGGHGDGYDIVERLVYEDESRYKVSVTHRQLAVVKHKHLALGFFLGAIVSYFITRMIT